MVTKITSESIDGAYLQLVKLVLSEGEMVRDERDNKTLEVCNIITEVKQPIPFAPVKIPIFELIHPPFDTFWVDERLEKYCKEFISPNRDGFIYTYGNRYRSWFNEIDQIQEAINRLNKCPETRRAISVTWDPKTDTVNNEVPCMILVDFKIRHGELQTTALWRSHDIGQAWYANAIGLTYLAQYVAINTNSTVSNLIIHSISAHIYESNIPECKRLVQ